MSEKERKDYEIVVNDLCANIPRSGICAALTAVQGLGERGKLLLTHLASADVPGMEGLTLDNPARRVRERDANAYVLATPEMLQVAMWLKRAVQAMFEEEQSSPPGQ